MSLILPFGGRTYVPAAGGYTSSADAFTGSDDGVAYEFTTANCFSDTIDGTACTIGDDIRALRDLGPSAQNIGWGAANGTTYQENSAKGVVRVASSITRLVDTSALFTPFANGGLAVWAAFRPAVVNSTDYIIGQNNTGTSLWGLLFDSATSKLALFGIDGSGGQFTALSTNALVVGTDYYVYGEIDTTSARLWIDGVAQVDGTNTAGTLASGSDQIFPFSRTEFAFTFDGDGYAIGCRDRIGSDRADIESLMTSLMP